MKLVNAIDLEIKTKASSDPLKVSNCRIERGIAFLNKCSITTRLFYKLLYNSRPAQLHLLWESGRINWFEGANALILVVFCYQ